MNITGDWLLDLIIWEECTDPYDQRTGKEKKRKEAKDGGTTDKSLQSEDSGR